MTTSDWMYIVGILAVAGALIFGVVFAVAFFDREDDE